MCGVVGIFPLNKLGLEIDPQVRRLVMLYLHNEVLFETVARGRDATGVALSFGAEVEGGNPYWAVLKQPVRTEDFFVNDGTSDRYKGQDEQANVERMMHVACLLNRPLNHVLGHTRHKTQGSEFNPLNNHPIIVNDIIGIHNGGVRNDTEIYKLHPKMTPQGDVDSEALIQLLAERAEGRALDVKDIEYVTERIEGPRAVMAYNRDHPETVIYFRNKERPLELVYIPELGMAMLCSEKKFFNAAITLYERARLTLKRDLPELSWDWRNIPADNGGVIDVSAEIDDTVKIEEMFPLVKCSSTLAEYSVKRTWSTATGFQGQNAGKASTSSVKTATKAAATGATTGEKKMLGPGTEYQTADIIDFTEYGPETKSSGSVGQTHSVKAVAVLDDNSDEEDDDLDDTSIDSSVLELYDDEALYKRGVDFALSEEVKDDETLFINIYEGNFKSRLAQSNLTEDAAAEIVHQLFPEHYGEGYVRGFKDGADEQVSSYEDEVDNVIETVQGMENELQQLRARLVTERGKQRKAANLIANMKSFLTAAVMTSTIGYVDGDGTGAKLVFDDDIEDLLNMAEGFRQVNMEQVRALFTAKDLRAMKSGFHNFAQKLNGGYDKQLEPVDGLSIKGITS